MVAAAEQMFDRNGTINPAETPAEIPEYTSVGTTEDISDDIRPAEPILAIAEIARHIPAIHVSTCTYVDTISLSEAPLPTSLAEVSIFAIFEQ